MVVVSPGPGQHCLSSSAVLPSGDTAGSHSCASSFYRPLSPLAFCVAASSRSYRRATSGANYRMEEVSEESAPETLLVFPAVTPCTPFRGGEAGF